MNRPCQLRPGTRPCRPQSERNAVTASHTAPLPTDLLDEDIRIVLEARRLVTRLATALVSEPFDERAHAEFQSFLETDGARARAAWRRINARTNQELDDQAKSLMLGIIARGQR